LFFQLVWHSGQVVGARGYWGTMTDSSDIAKPLASLQQKLEANMEVSAKLKEPLYILNNAGKIYSLLANVG
jgi:hypothetical protein